MKKQEFTPEELEKARKAKNEYMRKWKKNNPDKVRAAMIRHYLKKAESSNRQ